ncbi:MAG: hypothetical protein HOV83_34120, partial [Catenulispora sp.]|nr:hypothetical protein [Catenulispora sp.]
MIDAPDRLTDPRFALGAFHPSVLREVAAERLKLLRLLRHAGTATVTLLVTAEALGVAAVAFGAVATGRL